nr:glycoside hydrolase family 2 protein [Lachnospiraceae bacterium]
MRESISFNDGWDFCPEFREELLSDGVVAGAEKVRIPHSVKLTPLHYFDASLYQMISGYRRVFTAKEEWKGRRVFVRFMAVAHGAVVYLNGKELFEHRCGYTAFEVELTGALRYGAENVLTVKVNSREDQNFPPFGHVIDYLTYGGIYREVSLIVTESVRFSDVFVMPKEPEGQIPKEAVSKYRFSGRVETDITLDGDEDIRPEELSLELTVSRRKNGETVASRRLPFSEAAGIDVPEARLWDTTSPVLYALTLALYRGDEKLDELTESFGFRRSEFREDAYYLNGRRFKIRGLNRHQCYPYAGYAMPASQQAADAEILRFELGVNAVRTSHYPQSQHFIDRCDELGLLVFTEIPGWQHVGDQAWKEQAFVNLEEMVCQYRNHPSVILWGVRINESLDDDEFYEQTNAMAHALDPTRPTGGVRYLEKSHLLEDVYTFNDFSHEGTAPGCKKKAAVTPDMSKAYLISEYNGHMFPTKSFDGEEHRLEHALRHCNVLDAVNENRDIAGSFGWCMFDYNTHKDFGSGDRICYHGVMDMFRNPKLAAYVYASQQNRTPVLEVSSSMDIGEHPGGNRGAVYIFTNADSVRMYKNDVFIKE